MTSSANTLQTGDYAQLPSETIATLRKGIRAATDAGISQAAVEQDVQRKYGVSVKQVMAANPSDFGRTVAQGLTLNHADELAGLYAKLTGKSYEKARDSIRKNDAAFQQVHPVLKLLTEAAAGSLTGMAAAPIAALQKGATLANIGKSAALGAGLSGIAGEGASTAQTAGGVMGDAAKSATIGGLLGAGTGALASKIANVGLPQGAKGAAITEAASQLPADPTELRTALARQMQLAPKTVVLADLSPQMQRFVRAIGADRQVAMEVAASEGRRVQALLDAKRGVGQAYDQLQGLKRPADQAITDALNEVGRRDLIKAGDVDLGKLHELRSALLKASRSPSAGMKGTELGKAAGDITDWMQQTFPSIKQTDADYAFLTDRLKTAMKTQKWVLDSHSSYAANRAAGVQSGSLGGSIPMPNRGMVGTVITKAVNMTRPDRAARARAIATLLLTPQKDAQGLEALILTHNALLQSQEQPSLTMANAALSGGLLPQLSRPSPQ